MPAILYYRASDLYLTDRKPTMTILQKIPAPLSTFTDKALPRSSLSPTTSCSSLCLYLYYSSLFFITNQIVLCRPLHARLNTPPRLHHHQLSFYRRRSREKTELVMMVCRAMHGHLAILFAYKSKHHVDTVFEHGS